MEKREIRIGLLGFGAMGKTHAYAVSTLPYFCGELPFRAVIHGVATRSLEKSMAVAKEFGFAVATDHEDDLINDPQIDVIDICTPNILHADTVRRALAAGKHIYCEKPLADTLPNAQAMTEWAGRSDRVCSVVFNNRHLSAVCRAKQLIEDGRLGRILSFDFRYLHNSCTDPEKPAGWKQTAGVCGEGGVLFDLGSHIIDLAVFLCGKFRTVTGKSQIAFPTRKGLDGKEWQTDACEAFYMLAKTEDGATGTLTASKLATGYNDDLFFAIYGSKGSLRFSLMDPNYLEFYDNTAEHAPYGGFGGFTRIECVGRYPAPAGTFPSPKAAQGWLRGHVMSMYTFLNAVYLGKQASPTFAEAAYVQRVMDAALRSDQSGEERQVSP
ncbi:MAG: Gfo/Idh/MocA family oxidoreductase [Ruminococcaceae bacterium]|nr:Gfo/Idh/MocA family oxidoreductase [Oscillospiraceae bacterium]